MYGFFKIDRKRNPYISVGVCPRILSKGGLS
jgi:hypothetical protein